MKFHHTVLVALAVDALFWVGLLAAGTLIANHFDSQRASRRHR